MKIHDFEYGKTEQFKKHMAKIELTPQSLKLEKKLSGSPRKSFMFSSHEEEPMKKRDLMIEFSVNFPFLKKKEEKKKVETQFTDLKTCLKDPIAIKYFTKHCKEERNDEALLFYIQVNEFKKLPLEKLHEEGNQIYQDFLCQESKYGLNINKEMIDEINPKDIRRNSFDKIQKYMELLMTDSFLRFQKSNLFSEMETEMNISKSIELRHESRSQDDEIEDELLGSSSILHFGINKSKIVTSDKDETSRLSLMNFTKK